MFQQALFKRNVCLVTVFQASQQQQGKAAGRELRAMRLIRKRYFAFKRKKGGVEGKLHPIKLPLFFFGLIGQDLFVAQKVQGRLCGSDRFPLCPYFACTGQSKKGDEIFNIGITSFDPIGRVGANFPDFFDGAARRSKGRIDCAERIYHASIIPDLFRKVYQICEKIYFHNRQKSL